MITTITLDFGNTLVPVSGPALRGVIAATARTVAARLGPFDANDVAAIWAEERDRQFREEVPHFRETDMDVRAVRVLARLRGMPPPPREAAWDDTAAATCSDPEEVALVLAAYSDDFIASMPPMPGAAALIARLAEHHAVAILSNWPLASTIDRYAEVHGWAPHLSAIVVSQRVGTIKPHPAIFAAARAALGDPDPAAILHVGDDWAADIEGAKAVGWRAAWLTSRPLDSPLPGSQRTASVTPDLELASLADLESGLARLALPR